MLSTINKASRFAAAGALASLSMIFGVAANAQTVDAVGTDSYIREPDTYQVIGDNVDNYAADSGAISCRGGDTCVEKIGDTAEVEWTIQATNAVTSSDDSQISGQPVILVPEVVKNLSVTIDALPDRTAYQEMVQEITEPSQGGSNVEPASYPAKEVKAAGRIVEVTEYPYPQSEITNNLNDGADKWGIVKIDSVLGDKAPSGSGWDAYAVPADGGGIVTLTLKGEVTVESEDTYIPIRVTNSTWFCLLELCDSLQAYEWGRTGALPEFSLTDPEVNARVAALQTPQGRLGNPKCSPTSETNRYDLIGWDNLQPMASDRAASYVSTFNLNLNPAVNYTVSGYGANEDWCDQADVHITICDKAEEEVPPSEEPSANPSEGQTPAPNEPEQNASANEPGGSDDPEESKTVTDYVDEPKDEGGEEPQSALTPQLEANSQVNMDTTASAQQTQQQQASPQARNLPVTGSSTGLLAAGGAALLGLIAGGIYYASRRKSTGNGVD